MAIAGIIAEYNPFHNGHSYLLRTVREMGYDRIVTVMSGAFVQRGEPAIVSKRDRTEMALRGGADVVLELPLRGVLSSAQGFACSAVEVLAATGVVDALCFGSECGDTQTLTAISQALQTPGFDEALKQELATGISYPAARQNALERFYPDAAVLKNPNDLLGIEYLLAAVGRFDVHAIRRTGAEHDGTGGATFCREMLRAGGDITAFVPEHVPALLEQRVCIQDMERSMLARLRGLDAAYFAALPDVSEGLEYKIAAAVREGCSMENIIEKIKSKRYTRSRICRILMRAYLDVREGAGAPEYIRILGFRKGASGLIREIREKASLPVVQHPAADDRGFADLHKEIAANDRWGVFAPTVQAAGKDYREFPVVVE